jgi:integrase
MKVKDVVKEYMKTRRFRSLSTETQRQYLYGFDDINKFVGDMDAAQVKRRDMLKAVDELSVRPGTTNRFCRVASLLFNYAVDMEYTERNPAQRIAKPKMGTRERWTSDEIRKAMSFPRPIVGAAVALAYYTGQREGDILNMKWEDITDDTITVTQSKTGVILNIRLAKPLLRILSKMENKTGYIVSPDGKKMNGPAFRSRFKREMREIHIDKTFHGLRKTVGSHLAEKGSSINEIAALLGHKTLSMAALYTKQADKTKMISSAISVLDAD